MSMSLPLPLPQVFSLLPSLVPGGFCSVKAGVDGCFWPRTRCFPGLQASAAKLSLISLHCFPVTLNFSLSLCYCDVFTFTLRHHQWSFSEEHDFSLHGHIFCYTFFEILRYKEGTVFLLCRFKDIYVFALGFLYCKKNMKHKLNNNVR